MTTPPHDQQGTHFYLVVIQTPHGTGYSVGSYWGSITPRKRATRLDLFNEVVNDIRERNPESRDGSVITFDIQPNKL